ncbi:MAG: GTP cyclohydrolase I FolE2 [Candidatus Freyarchaeota archaeon]|nr:GTP cyclohydrolase I FolE2 [Candidatus Jordarchaeia archaeon]
MSGLPDVQNEMPRIPLSLDEVGITGLIKRVRIAKGKSEVFLTPKISAFINLPRKQRGVHLSRSSEAIESIVDDVTYSPVESVEELCRKILMRLLEKHEYADRARVLLEGPAVFDVRASESEVKRQKAYMLHVEGVATRKKEKIGVRVFLGVDVEGMTACPCAQELIRDYAESVIRRRAEEFSLSTETIRKILDLVPLASHSQRCKGTLIVEVKDSSIDIYELAKVVEDSMSGVIQDVLKRPDEASLVRLAHLNPLFVEDVARLIIMNALTRLRQLSDDAIIEVRVESIESVHPHNVVAYRRARVGELKKEFQAGCDA